MSATRLFVKVCGITCVADGLAAAELGADAVGFVFWPGSPRHVEPEAARRIGEALPPSVVRVGVFVDAPAGELARVAEAARLDVLQLHGSEPPEQLALLPLRAWKALRVGPDFAPAELARYAQRAAAILLDTRAESVPGGSGRSFDWRVARQARERAGFLILAGGLSADNVAQAIASAAPDGVDVSSGVEASPGRKDTAKLRDFLAAARQAS
jgi:phosphoribosylanthranilate isomerase